MRQPRLCCLDLDTFFVSVERLFDPSLVGRPVIVGGRPGSRGVVTACSYEVRASGVRSGMSLTEAARRAPDAIYLPVRGDAYSEYSKKVRAIVDRYSPVVQAASIDEMFIDFSGCERLYRRPGDFGDDATILRTVRDLRSAIQTELGLPSSVGIATSRSMAKVASGLAKPAGVLMVPAGQEAQVLSALPVRKLPGIGPVAERNLQAIGIETLGEVAACPRKKLHSIFGAWAEQVWRGANGLGSSDISRDQPAFREHDDVGDIARTISNERTFHEDVSDPWTIASQLCFLSERVSWRARRRGIEARTVTLKMRYADFETITRSRTVLPTSSEVKIHRVVKELFRLGRQRKAPIRLLGVALSKLSVPDLQLDLFDEQRAVRRSIDSIRAKYGFEAVGRATASLRKRSKTVGGAPDAPPQQPRDPMSETSQ